MEDEEIVVSPSPIDLSPLLDKIEQLILLQGENIKIQNELKDYLIPSEEELQQLEKEKIENEKLENELLEKEEEQLQEKEKEQYENYLTDLSNIYSLQLEDIKSELVKLNDSNIINNEFTTTNTGLSYILVFGLIFTFVITFLYKIIRKFY